MANPIALRAQLDCQSCFEPFSPQVGPRFPRILSPCAHTFCTECIEKQLQARGPNDFRCLTHNQAIQINKAEDVKANFALIELLERIAADADHQAVDERTKPPACSECDEPSVWYCKNDDACFCDAHKISEHAARSRSNHVLMPVAERTVALPKCSTHKSKDLDLWCTQCSAMCCTMCERSGTHKEHADKLAPVDDVVLIQRSTIERLATEAAELSADKLDKEAHTLVAFREEYEAAARRVQEEMAKEEAEMISAVQARYAELRNEAQKQLANGLKHIDMRVDDLTMSRSRAAMVSEEAARVLRMSDYALLAHVSSVEQHATRSRKGWDEYHLNSLLPQPMQFLSAPAILHNEVAVAGLVDQPWSQLLNGTIVPAARPALPMSAHRSEERMQAERVQEQQTRLLARQREKTKQLQQLHNIEAQQVLISRTAHADTLESLLKSVACRRCRQSFDEADAQCMRSCPKTDGHHWNKNLAEPLLQLLANMRDANPDSD